jgi:hypothetical protein
MIQVRPQVLYYDFMLIALQFMINREIRKVFSKFNRVNPTATDKSRRWASELVLFALFF